MPKKIDPQKPPFNTKETNFSAIYVHVPFCEVICHYCDFYTAKHRTAQYDRFYSGLKKELSLYNTNLNRPLKTLYFGGGTPSASPISELASFIESLVPLLNNETEITLETNPSNINENNLRSWKNMGINRLSIGVQSLNDHLLKKLGRIHNSSTAKTTIQLASSFFSNISVDLLYGVPNQPLDALEQDALFLLYQCKIQHLSAYALSLEKNHFLHSKLLSSDVAIEQISRLRSLLEKHSWAQYEVSNFSIAGFQSKHNKNYWEGGAYLALGPSAHGFDGKRTRWKNTADWQKYLSSLEAGFLPIEWTEELTPEQRLLEQLFTQIRTPKGIALAKLEKQHEVDFFQKKHIFLHELEQEGLGTIHNGHLIPSFRGLMMGDSIVHQLL